MTNEKSGWLIKEGGSIKTWKKRYFVLKNGEFRYSKNPREEALGVIKLSAASTIRIVDKKKKNPMFSKFLLLIESMHLVANPKRKDKHG